MTDETSTAMARPLAVTPVPVMGDKEIEQTWRVAKALAASGFYKDARQAEAAFAKILLGRDLGLSPTESMQALHVFDGKVEASADFHATRVKRTPGYDYEVAFGTTEDGLIAGCKITFYGPKFGEDYQPLGESEFTLGDAEAAGIAKKDVWKKYPRNMLFARAMSNGVAWFCPEVMGAVRVYSPGEIEEVTEEAYTLSSEEEQANLESLAHSFPPGTCAMILGVVQRARALGHANLADVGTIELSLRDQPAEFAEQWCRDADEELDAFEKREQPPEAEVVLDPPVEAEAWPKPDDTRCGVPDPHRDGKVCALREGHPGPHYADEQTWTAPEQVGDPAGEAQRLRDEANALLDQAGELREIAAEAEGDSSLANEENASRMEAEAEAKRAEADRIAPPQETLGGGL